MNFGDKFEHLLTPEWKSFFLDYAKFNELIHLAKKQLFDVTGSSSPLTFNNELHDETSGSALHATTMTTSSTRDPIEAQHEHTHHHMDEHLDESSDVVTYDSDGSHPHQNHPRKKLVTFGANTVDRASSNYGKKNRSASGGDSTSFSIIRTLSNLHTLVNTSSTERTGRGSLIHAKRVAICQYQVDRFQELMIIEIRKMNEFFERKDVELTKKHDALLEQIKVFRTKKDEGLLARKRQLEMLREAFIEHYRFLNLLLNYRTVNQAAIVHLCHKFDRTLHGNLLQREIVANQLNYAYFMTNSHVQELIDDCRTIVTDELYPNDPSEAKKQLRLVNQVDYGESFAGYTTGILTGIAGLLSLVVVIYYFTAYAQMKIFPYFSSMSMYMYRIYFYPTVMALGIAFNVRIWNRSRINYVYIFDFPPSTHLSKWRFLQFGLFSYCLLCTSAVLYMWFVVMQDRGQLNFHDLSWIHPVVLYGVLFIWFFFPSRKYLFGEIRFWLMGTLTRISLAPFFKVPFTDFWMGDQLTSLADTLFELQFIACAFTDEMGLEHSAFHDACLKTQQLGVPVLNIFPFYARAMQCLRRYYDSKQKTQLFNFLKYFLCIVVILIAFVQRAFTTGRTKVVVTYVWLSVNIVSTLYKCFWDIVMDWSLIMYWDDKESRYRFCKTLLRPELLFRPIWYYVAAILNCMMRFMWLVSYLLRTYVHLRSVDWLIFTVVIVEILRRIVWNIFRLENEHLTNCEHYRLIREVPLPFEVIASDRLVGIPMNTEKRNPIRRLIDWISRSQRRRYRAHKDIEPTQESDVKPADESTERHRKPIEIELV